MLLHELKLLVSQGESQFLEFKKKVDFPEKVLREVIAFANSSGGTLLIGVNDDGSLSGLKFPEEEAYVLEEAMSKLCKPEVNYTKEVIRISKSKSVVRYDIPEGTTKPYLLVYNDSCESFIRISDKSIKISPEMQEILRRKNTRKGTHIYYGKYEELLMRGIDQNGFITLSDYMKLSGLNRYRASRKLIKLVLANVLTIKPGEKEDLYSLNEIHAKL